ncbi:uncharacterized protein LOC122322712 [Drosophila grimshawi]|uniref:uncharacterized protein LOC122322712 n=1 Tax=Drosophila grimshawi TaxID=7222 RepID=UPI001C9362BD|nr:uncharacterized protein LOC122322712 [Drosophila grimshawi]
MKNRIRQQVPLSLVHYIIPENLTDVVKNFIKAVLKENPENLLVFARKYFQKLRLSKAKIDYTKYAAYEKYTKENAKWSQESKVICTCGRVLEGKTGQQSVKTLEIDKYNYNLRAVCIIQKHYRNYLKRKAERSAKVNLLTTDIYKNTDYLNAISLIQRQFRRYLSKKRAKNTVKLTNTSVEKYNSVQYISAIYIIQRQCRLYLTKKRLKRPPIKSGSLPLDTSVSITTAALIIQRAFRRMVKVVKDRRHTNAELEQSDDINDNASEAGSYTSASTALLSTESAGEHNELGGINYEEGVHQQTINEDEEVENDYKNQQKQHVTEAIKSSEKSIISNGNGNY